MLRSRCAFALALVLGGCAEDFCFIAGTRVATPSGPRPIEQLEVGDEVIAFVPETGGTVVRRVARVMRRRVHRTRALQFADRTLVTTDEHPFYDAEGRRWIPAAALAEEHVLVGYDEIGTRPVRVPRFELSFVPVEVYNLSVGGPEQTYFAEGIAVHNKSPAPEPPRVHITNDTDEPVQLDFFGSPDVCLSNQLWTATSVRLPAEQRPEIVESVSARARGTFERALREPESTQRLCQHDRAGERRRGMGKWVGIAGTTYVADDPGPDLSLRVTEAGLLVGVGTTTVLPVEEVSLCTDVLPQPAPRQLFALREGTFPANGIVESSTVNAAGCLTVVLAKDDGDAGEVEICVPEASWPFVAGDSVEMSAAVAHGIVVQSATDARRLEMIDGPLVPVDELRYPEPMCLEASEEMGCTSRRVTPEVSVEGQWLRPGEQIVSGATTVTFLYATSLAVDAGCDAIPRARMQMLRVTR